MCVVQVHAYGAVEGKATFSYTKLKSTEFLQHYAIIQTKGYSKQLFLSLQLPQFLKAEVFLVTLKKTKLHVKLNDLSNRYKNIQLIVKNVNM
jgi:hypothetical protein